jgi:hypothetical protein
MRVSPVVGPLTSICGRPFAPRGRRAWSCLEEYYEIFMTDRAGGAGCRVVRSLHQASRSWTPRGSFQPFQLRRDSFQPQRFPQRLHLLRLAAPYRAQLCRLRWSPALLPYRPYRPLQPLCPSRQALRRPLQVPRRRLSYQRRRYCHLCSPPRAQMPPPSLRSSTVVSDSPYASPPLRSGISTVVFCGQGASRKRAHSSGIIIRARASPPRDPHMRVA